MFFITQLLGEAPLLDSVADARSAGKNWVLVGVKDGKFYAVANGKRWGPYDFAKILGVGKGFWAFAGFEGREVKGVVNGKEYGPFVDLCCAFEAGDNWLVMGKAAEGKVVLVNGKTWGPYSKVWGPVTSGSNWAFWFNEGRAKALVANGRRWGPYNEISRPTFSKGKVLFTAILEGEYFIIWGDTALGPYKGVMKLESDEGGWAAAAWDKKGFYALANGSVRGPFAYCRLENGVFTIVERKRKGLSVRQVKAEDL